MQGLGSSHPPVQLKENNLQYTELHRLNISHLDTLRDLARLEKTGKWIPEYVYMTHIQPVQFCVLKVVLLDLHRMGIAKALHVFCGGCMCFWCISRQDVQDHIQFASACIYRHFSVMQTGSVKSAAKQCMHVCTERGHFGLYSASPDISGEDALELQFWDCTIQPKVARLEKIGKSRPNQAAYVVPCDLS